MKFNNIYNVKKYQIPRHPVFKDFGIINTQSGTYVCPGWHPVPPGTTRAQIELVDSVTVTPEKKSPEVLKTPARVTSWQVESSNGKSSYTVKSQPHWSCTCPASQFRRGDCKHIKKIKAELKQKSPEVV